MRPLSDLPEPGRDFRALRDSHLADEAQVVAALLPLARLDASQAGQVSAQAAVLIDQARAYPHPLFSEFLQRYRLDSQEGRVLLTLAEALLRIPDSASRNELINCLLPQADWGQEPAGSPRTIQWAGKALHLARRFIEEKNFSDRWHTLLLKMGDGVIRPALGAGIQVIARQFVLAETIPAALAARDSAFRYSFDCLGEAAQTLAEADRYYRAYHEALGHLSTRKQDLPLLERDSISIKLSALHPRYDIRNWDELQATLLPRLIELVGFAAEAGLPVTFDAEESERLELGLMLYAEVARQPRFEGYEGLGLAVQAYQKRAPAVLDWLARLAGELGRRLPVRLVKGAYWDSEIKRAQQLGLRDYPVFTRKLHTDLCYLACARKMLTRPDCFWPQFATHNAHTLAWLDAVADNLDQDYEVQRLVGMGDAVHHAYRQLRPRACRLYAPIGEFHTLLPYLVRRLLENGSSQSFVNLLADPRVDSRELARDPLALITAQPITPHPRLPRPPLIYAPRPNSPGFSLSDLDELSRLRDQLAVFDQQLWQAGVDHGNADNEVLLAQTRHSPVDHRRILGTVYTHSAHDVAQAYTDAAQAFETWRLTEVRQRAGCLRRMAELMMEHQAELLYLLMLEGGKVLADALGEWREAVDLCQYYASEAERVQTPQTLPGVVGELNQLHLVPRGVFLCLSPWNFPLAIFLGQITAALVTGNTVVAKSASQTPLIAERAVHLLHEAGIPKSVLMLVSGPSRELGDVLLTHPALAGVVFTGSTATARHIAQTLAARPGALVPLIAETGGLNAMIADSSALPEQLVQDVLQSAFNSAGQRCSALRVLWLQEDGSEAVLERLAGALATWRIDDPRHVDTDVGPVIDGPSLIQLEQYGEHLQSRARWQAIAPVAPDREGTGHYLAPRACLIDRADLPDQEVFGPILHIVTWRHDQLDDVIRQVNRSGYGLTLGIHSRINSHIEHIRRDARVGNLYINRNQIGAVVGSQPFGGEGLSGTGFKAGGPHYLLRFCTERTVTDNLTAVGINSQLLDLE